MKKVELSKEELESLKKEEVGNKLHEEKIEKSKLENEIVIQSTAVDTSKLLNIEKSIDLINRIEKK